MTPREIVRRTLDYEGPERVARTFDGGDMVSAGARADTPATPWREVGGGRWERVDEWGNVWGRVDESSKGEVVRGVLEDWNQLDRLELPDFSDPRFYDGVRAARRDHPDYWLLAGMHGFAFNIARKMRKLDVYLTDLFLEPERISALHDRIDALCEDMIRNYAAAGADAVMFPEDWGTQRELLVSHEVFREEFLPRYEKLCGIAQDCGIRVFLHSCGQITAIVPWLMDAGVDLFQFDQPELHGLDALESHQARGKVTFWCGVDIQTTLQTRDEGLIRAKAREMLDRLWAGRGGFVAGFYGDNASIGLEPKWQEYACDEFERYGKRERYAASGAF